MQLLNVVLGVLGAQRLQRNQLKKRPLQAACYLVASCKLLGCKVVVINLKKATASFSFLDRTCLAFGCIRCTHVPSRFSKHCCWKFWKLKVANIVLVFNIVIVIIRCTHIPWQVIFPNIVIGLEGAQCTHNHSHFLSHSRSL